MTAHMLATGGAEARRNSTEAQRARDEWQSLGVVLQKSRMIGRWPIHAFHVERMEMTTRNEMQWMNLLSAPLIEVPAAPHPAEASAVTVPVEKS